MKFAGFWIRFAALLLDGIILLPLLILQALLSAYSVVYMYVTYVASVWLYNAFFESYGWQATPGKRLCGIRVVGETGERLSFWRASGRYFAKYLSGLFFGIGYLMAGLTSKKQGLHDILARTYVVYGISKGFEPHEASEMSRRTLGAERNEGHSFASDSAGSAWILAGFGVDGRVLRFTFFSSDARLLGDGLIVGRDQSVCSVVLNDASVSRTHARFFVHDNTLFVEDLGSTNGTQLNGKSLRLNESVRVPDVGELVFGERRLSIAKQ